jgi:uncharacterized protein (TIGR03067 family)
VNMTAMLFLALGGLLEADPTQDIAKADKDRLQGIWRIERVVEGGEQQKNVAADLAIDGDKLGCRFMLAGLPRATVFTFVLDPRRTPKCIDLIHADGDDIGKTLRGIYQLDRDSLKLCIGDPGGERPLEFKSQPGSKRTLFILKREKS